MLGLTIRQRQAALILLILLAVGGSLLMFRRAYPAAVEFPVATESKPIYIHLTGAVRQPGVLQLHPGTRVFEALEAAGGALPEADLNRINLAKFIIDGEQLYVPVKEETLPRPPVSGSKRKTASAVADAKVSGPLDLNRATQTQLETVPGIGPALARRIIAYREAHGGFQTYEELDEVSGIGPSTLEKFRPFFGAL